MNIDKLTHMQYENIYNESVWFSPIQINDFSNAVIVMFNNSRVLAFNYCISNGIANIFLTVFDTKYLSKAFDECIDMLIKQFDDLRQILTYLVDPNDSMYLNNSFGLFSETGRHKNGIKIDGEKMDLLIFSMDIYEEKSYGEQ